MQFPSLFHKNYDVQKDSWAENLIAKAVETFEYLNGNQEYFDELNTEFFSRLAFQLGTPDSELETAKSYTDTFFENYNPLIVANEKLKECLFDASETQFLENEASCLLAYLEVIQKKCKEHIDKIPNEYLTNKSKEINRNIQNPELKLKEHFPPTQFSPIEVETAEPSDLNEGDLITLSTTLKELHEKRAQLEKLRQESEAMFQAIHAWKRAKETGKGEALPPLEKFEELRKLILGISLAELNFPPHLLQKATLCSKAAGRALEQIAATAKRVNGQILETRDALKSNFQNYLSDFKVWKLTKQFGGKVPSPGDVIRLVKDEPNPELSTLALLGTIDWLNNLPETKLQSLERAFADLSPSEKGDLEKLIQASATPEEFFSKLSRYYEEKTKAVASQAQKNNQALEREKARLQQEVQTRETKLASLSAEKVRLDQQLQKLAQQLDAIQKEQNVKSEEALKEAERKLQALKRQIEELNKRASALESEKSELTTQLQILKQNLARTHAQHAKEQEEASKQIKELESHCQTLQKELTSSTASRDQVSAGLAGQIRDLRDQLEQSVSESRGKLQALETQLRDKDRQVADLKEEKASLHAEIRALKQQTEKTYDWESQLATLTLQLGEKDAQVASLKEEKAGLEKEIRVLKEQTEKELSDTQKQIISLQTKLKDQQAQVTRTESEKALLTTKMGESEKALAAAQRRLDSLQKELEGQRSAVSISQSKKTALKEQIRAIREHSEKQRAEVQARLDTTQNELVEQKKVVAALETERAALEKRIRDLKVQFETERSAALATLQSHIDQIAKQRSEVARLSREKRELEARLKDLANDRADAQSEIEHRQSELELLKEHIANSEACKAQLEQLHSELKEKVEEERFQARSALDDLQKELAQQKRQVASLEDEKAGLENRIRELSAQVENFEKERVAAQNKLKGLQNELAQQNEHVARLESVKAGLEQEFRELSQRSANELSDAKKQLESLQKELEEEKQKRAHAETVVDGLNHQIQQLNEQLQAVQTSAATAQSTSEKTIEELEQQKRRLEAELKIHNGNAHPPGSTGDTYSGALADFVASGQFLVNFQKTFSNDIQSHRSEAIGSVDVLQRLKDIHQIEEDPINWAAIACMTEIMQLVLPQQLAFELLNQFITYIHALHVIDGLQKEEARYERSRLYIQNHEVGAFMRKGKELYRAPIHQRKSELKKAKIAIKFLKPVSGISFDQLCGLYDILNFDRRLVNYANPIKLLMKDFSNMSGTDPMLDSIIFCDSKECERDPWEGHGLIILESLRDVGLRCAKGKVWYDDTFHFPTKGIPPEQAISLYSAMKQGLRQSYPVACQMQSEELNSKIARFEDEKSKLKAQLERLKGEFDDDTLDDKAYIMSQHRYDEFVKTIDIKINQLETLRKQLSANHSDGHKDPRMVCEPDSKMEDLKRELQNLPTWL